MFVNIPEIIFYDPSTKIEKRSFNDWGVYWSGNSIDTPTPQKSYVKVPFRNGMLDLTSTLTDKIVYEERKFSFDFIVDEVQFRSWSDIYSMIMGDIHGKSLRVTKTTDPDFYWDAYECIISGAPSEDKGILKFTIEGTCFPYKLRWKETRRTFQVTGANTLVDFTNGRMEVTPTFWSLYDVTVKTLNAGGQVVSSTTLTGGSDHTFSNIEFKQGKNTLRFDKISSDTPVVVRYREGEL